MPTGTVFQSIPLSGQLEVLLRQTSGGRAARKFSIYPVIAQAIQESGAGLHLKTAGTTWLEELIGLAEARW